MNKRTLFRLSRLGCCIPLLLLSGGAFAASICEGDQKIEGDGGNHTYAPGGGDAVAEVCIKAGRETFSYSCGEVDTSGCYTLEWSPDCYSVTISGGGTDRDCKSISHTAATFVEGPGCVPSEEICDGADNDCDGQVDEGEVCGCQPSEEICDGADNDCDGQVDEGEVCGGPVCVPTEEICDGEDNDCDELIDEGEVCGGETPGGDLPSRD